MKEDFKKRLVALCEKHSELAIRIIKNSELYLPLNLIKCDDIFQFIGVNEVRDIAVGTFVIYNSKVYRDINEFLTTFYNDNTRDIVYTPIEEDVWADGVKYAQEHIQKAILIIL